MLGQGIAFLTLLVTGTVAILNQTRPAHTEDDGDDTDDRTPKENEDTAADTAAASPGPAVEPQSQADPLSDTDDTDDTHEPLNRTGLRRSNDDILEEAGTKLRDQIDIHDDGMIDLDNYDDLDLYRRLMLYVVAKRMVYDDRFIDAPEVTVDDINDRPEFDYNKIELLLFLNEARKWLVAPTEAAPALRTIDYTTLDDAVFTVRTRSLAKIADWILDEPLPDMRPSNLSSRLSSTAMMLKDARSQYDDIREDGVTNDSYNADHRYDPVRQKIVRACEYAGEYPVMFERDNAWTQFTEYAEALLDFFEDGLYTKTEHCLPEMQRYQRHMEEKADDASYF